MTLSTFTSALAKRGASEATLSAGGEIQICVDGQWRAQTGNFTDAALDEMIAKALPLDEEPSWRGPEARANFGAQGFNVEATKRAGAVTVKLKQIPKPSGGPVTAQTAGALKGSASSTSVFAPTTAPGAAGTPFYIEPDAPPAPTQKAPKSNATPPPAPGAGDQWYYLHHQSGGEQRGPFSLNQMWMLINSTTIVAGTLVWKEGMSEWLPVARTELNAELPKNNGAGAAVGAPVAPPTLPSGAPPPLPRLAGEWFYNSADTGRQGPVAAAKIGSLLNGLIIDANTLVWRKGMSDWLPLAQTELNTLLPHNPWGHGVGASAPAPGFSMRSNGSGQGEHSSALPTELQGFNWGAFFIPFFWGIAHETWIALLCLITGLVGAIFGPLGSMGAAFGFSFWLGMQGNEFAWRNRKWSSVQEFEDVQQKWATSGMIIFGLSVIAISAILGSNSGK